MKHLLIIFVGSVVLLAAVKASAQDVKRIQFARGKTAATVTGSTGAYGTTYVVRARAGQKLVLTLASRPVVGIKVEKEGRYGHEVLLKEEGDGTFEVGLDESGDVTIFIGSTSARSAAFTLTVKIVKMTDI